MNASAATRMHKSFATAGARPTMMNHAQLIMESPAQIGDGRILAEKWSVSKVKEN
jgi:hypothetical protein